MNRHSAGLLFDVFVVLAGLTACVACGAPWQTWTAITASVIAARIASQRPPGGGGDDDSDGTPRGVPRLGAPREAPPRAPLLPVAGSGAAAIASGFVALARGAERVFARVAR